MPRTAAANTGGVQVDEALADDLLYFARSNDLTSFQEVLGPIKERHSGCTAAELLISVRDDYTGNTVAHLAAANGCTDILCFLLAAGPAADTIESDHGVHDSKTAKGALVDPSAHHLLATMNHSGNTPLHYAAMNAQIDVVRTLVQALDCLHRASGSQGFPPSSLDRATYVGLRNHAHRTAAEEAEAAGQEGFEAVVGFLDAAAQVFSNANDDRLENVQIPNAEEALAGAGAGADDEDDDDDINNTNLTVAARKEVGE